MTLTVEYSEMTAKIVEHFKITATSANWVMCVCLIVRWPQNLLLLRCYRIPSRLSHKSLPSGKPTIPFPILTVSPQHYQFFVARWTNLWMGPMNTSCIWLQVFSGQRELGLFDMIEDFLRGCALYFPRHGVSAAFTTVAGSDWSDNRWQPSRYGVEAGHTPHGDGKYLDKNIKVCHK